MIVHEQSRTPELLSWHRLHRGQSLVEVVTGLTIIVPIALALIDLSAVLYAISLNDTACRNAARAAATGSPGEAKLRAESIVLQANSGQFNSSFAHFSLLTPVRSTIKVQPAMQIDPDTDKPFNPGGLVTGDVSVTTEVEVKPFVMSMILKGQTPLVFRSTQNCPIRYMQPAGVATTSSYPR